MKRPVRLILPFFVVVGFLVLSVMLHAQIAGHESDLVKNQGLQSLLALASTQSTGIQRSAILTRTQPAAFLLWDEGVAIVIEAHELVEAGFSFGNAPDGFVFDKEAKRILITRDDWTSLHKPVQSKAAVFAQFLLNRPHVISYDATLAQFAVSVGAGYALWSNIFENPAPPEPSSQRSHAHHNHNHNHDDLIAPLGQSPQLTLVMDATPFIRRGLNPQKLENFTYSEEPSGFLGLFRRRSLSITFTL